MKEYQKRYRYNVKYTGQGFLFRYRWSVECSSTAPNWYDEIDSLTTITRGGAIRSAKRSINRRIDADRKMKKHQPLEKVPYP